MNDQTSGLDDGESWPGLRNTKFSDAGDDCVLGDLSNLIHAVETDVIPNLLTAYRRPGATQTRPSEADVAALSSFMLDDNVTGALRFVEQLTALGIGVESIYLELFGATARRLGEMWENDEIGFIDVTIGLCALHQLLFRMAPRLEADVPVARPNRRALFVPTPGETHFFGALIAAKVFAQAGWQSWTEVAIQPRELIALVKREDFAIIGFSMATERFVDQLAETITAVRKAGAHRGLRIIVGGAAFALDPDLGRRVGADAVALDAKSGVRLAESLVDALAASEPSLHSGPLK